MITTEAQTMKNRLHKVDQQRSRAAALLIIAAIGMLLSACGLPDPYATEWKHFRLGDSRTSVELLLGRPATVYAIEVPVLKLEQAVWKTVGGRVYIVHFAMDRVVTKAVIE